MFPSAPSRMGSAQDLFQGGNKAMDSLKAATLTHEAHSPYLALHLPEPTTNLDPVIVQQSLSCGDILNPGGKVSRCQHGQSVPLLGKKFETESFQLHL